MGTAIPTPGPLATPSTPPLAPKKKAPISGPRKAAILMVLLGDEVAVQIYRNLGPEDVGRLTQEIAEVETISPEEALRVLEEYQGLTLSERYSPQGGPEYASRLVQRAFGDDRAKGPLEQAIQAQQTAGKELEFLRKANPEQLVKFLQGEQPQTVALVLAYVGVESASSVLPLLPKKAQAETIKRLAQLKPFSGEMLQKVSLVLHKRLATSAKDNRRSYEGVSVAARTLNRMDPKSCKVILDSLQESEPDLAETIRNQMFTFDDLDSLPAVSLRAILAEVDKKTLGMALKGAREEIRAVFYECMSSRAADMLKEDMEALGPVRMQQVQEAQKEIITVARKLEAEGKISLKSGGEDGYVE